MLRCSPSVRAPAPPPVRGSVPLVAAASRSACRAPALAAPSGGAARESSGWEWTSRVCATNNNLSTSAIYNYFFRILSHFTWGRCVGRVVSTQLSPTSALVLCLSLSRPPWSCPSIVTLACPSSSSSPVLPQTSLFFPCSPLLFYMTRPPQPLFLHFPWYYSHFRYPCNSFMSHLIQLCYSTHPPIWLLITSYYSILGHYMQNHTFIISHLIIHTVHTINYCNHFIPIPVNLLCPSAIPSKSTPPFISHPSIFTLLLSPNLPRSSLLLFLPLDLSLHLQFFLYFPEGRGRCTRKTSILHTLLVDVN